MKKTKQKSPYIDPELEILQFGSDLITTSGGGGSFDWGAETGGGNGDDDAWT